MYNPSEPIGAVVSWRKLGSLMEREVMRPSLRSMESLWV
jgi:hypothetical protein